MSKNVKIENGKIYAESTLCERKDVFEIVKKIPSGFYVWNIGENMGLDEYIPLAEDLKPNDKENFEINPYTLKAIKLSVEDVKLLRAAAGWGVNSKAAAVDRLDLLRFICRMAMNLADNGKKGGVA